MTSAALTGRWHRPVARWEPPMDPNGTEGVLAKLRAWKAYDGDALLDDVADALDSVMPPEADVKELAQRLRDHLKQVVNIAITAKAEKRDARAAKLLARARAVRAEELPADYEQATSHLRRMGWAVNELLDLLVATGCMKAPDSLKENE
ncbi:DUF6415 family natural product biosynthesis protein [Streptomyces sp. NBC_01142]|uniref:DUF6415 family natural product biosynthesis protein n=1 Tax=Streptomyces sp. NBC_01142 TaxID=2975865 RepID=UPI00225A44D1|nr:DUF6415 family natural product biosynthesis protein [Streptomyces sp. NBC_01142]MCX4826058.1 DUF6415 family natural product biosynthesis protein [Streptomyces sp. NBC_01142]